MGFFRKLFSKETYGFAQLPKHAEEPGDIFAALLCRELIQGKFRTVTAKGEHSPDTRTRHWFRMQDMLKEKYSKQIPKVFREIYCYGNAAFIEIISPNNNSTLIFVTPTGNVKLCYDFRKIDLSYTAMRSINAALAEWETIKDNKQKLEEITASRMTGLDAIEDFLKLHRNSNSLSSPGENGESIAS